VTFSLFVYVGAWSDLFVTVWLAGIILGRDVGLGIAAIYYRWISLPPPKTLSRYWDFSLPSAEVHPTNISKYNTALQLALIGATAAMPLLTLDVSAAMTAMQYVFLIVVLRHAADCFKVSSGHNNNMEWCELHIYERCCKDT
jgi:phosphatidylglycerophosphate synthase